MKSYHLCWFLLAYCMAQSSSFIATASAQGLLDQFRNRVEGELRQAIEGNRVQPGPSQPPIQSRNPPHSNSKPSEGGNQNNPGGSFRSNSVPWEAGNQNNPGGNFRDSGGFLVPSSPPPSNMGSQRTIPQTGNPSQRTFQQGSSIQQGSSVQQGSSIRQGSSIPSSTYREVPVRQTASNGQPIKLKLPDSMRQSVKYQLILGSRSLDYEMRPGESQTFSDTNPWLVRYRSEGSEVTYRLRGGNTYEFEVDTQGRISLFEKRPDEFPEPPKR